MIYFDNAATTLQKPRQVARAMEAALLGCANPGRSGHRPALRAAETVYQCRQELAELFGVESPERIVFTQNATHALNIAIKSILYGGGLFLIFFAVLEFCPGVVLKLFDASDNLMRIGVPALRILAVAYLLSIPGLIYQAALQGLSLGKESMYISMTRQAILPLMFAFLLKGFGNLNLIWGAFVLAELCGIPLAAALWKRKGEKQIQF